MPHFLCLQTIPTNKFDRTVALAAVDLGGAGVAWKSLGGGGH